MHFLLGSLTFNPSRSGMYRGNVHNSPVFCTHNEPKD